MTEKNATEQQRNANDDGEQFDRFEQLTRRLLAVPKKEADAKAEEFKRRKSKKPR